MLKKIADKLNADPNRIFIYDGLGALFTAFSLGVVLVNLQPIFGIPISTLKVLSIIPLFYFLYDCFCYFKAKNNLGFYIKGIAILNLLYCPISIWFHLYDGQSITLVGWIYIVVEIIGVAAIAILEFKFAKKLTQKDF